MELCRRIGYPTCREGVAGKDDHWLTLYDHGTIPVSVLVTSSIVQDGHGMLPLLAHSWRDFLKVKAINLAVGLVVGILMYFLHL